VDFSAAWHQARDVRVPDRIEALRWLATHRPELPGFVYVRLTEAMVVDPQNAKVCINSVPLCKCGLRRMIVPAYPRMELRPAAIHIVSEAKPLKITPWGGDYSSTLAIFCIRRDKMFVRIDPFAQGQVEVNLRITAGSEGAMPLNMLPEVSTPLSRDFNGVPIALCQIVGRDLANNTVSVQLDETVQVADPMTPGHYDCRV
jgi:hypothetical protein